MKVILEIEKPDEVEKLMRWLHKNRLLSQVKVETAVSDDSAAIVRGDKRIDPQALFGIWKDNPRTLEEIRKAAWDRNP
ncbi:MAG: hypothetical protein LH606_04345 [Cytophagaceae bacterium]|nr:hypothetical protein [Cytophagaceae bacterium]